MNVFKLEAAIGLNTSDYQKGLAAAGAALKDFSAKAVKIGAAATSAAAAGVAALTKSAVSAYADYEQLVGGVEKLFGESSDLLMMYAKDAATSAGMSVNEYMETATSFAAALTTSVKAAGGSMDEAVEYADTAMRDMSDNANTFGTELSSIQTAYQGFAKQNYTMLDNLKLGYGGTKAEMERLIEDANELRRAQGINNELTIDSYADIITAIHTVQTEMNITGTTAREASKTISGSIGSVKAAWKNLTIEIAKEDGDINGAFEVLSENVGNVIENMLPRVEQALGGVGTLIEKAAPKVIKGISNLLPKILPSLLNSATSLVASVGSVAIDSLQYVPELLDFGKNALKKIAEGIETSDFDVNNNLFTKILSSIVGNSADYFKYAQQIMTNLANKLLDVDYGALAKNISTVFVNAVNSMTDFIKSIDFYKVGENIADFLNGIDWHMVANSIFDLLAAAIKAIPDMAVSFFANANLDSLITAIGLMSGKSLLGGIGGFFNSPEGTSLTQGIGESWSASFMAGIKAFGLGWAIGSYLRDNITIGDKTIGEWVDAGTEKLFGDVDEKADKEWGVGTTVKDEKGRDVITHNPDGSRTSAFDLLLKKNAEKQAKAWSNFDIEEYRRQNHLMGYADGGRVTHPQLAIVGEKEPETIIPDSKLGSIGNTTNYITINVDGYNIKNDEEFTELLSRKLSELSVRQQRAVGGAGW